MLPSIEEAKRELDIAAQLNPGPWVKHSLNVGIAARNIAEKVPGLDEEKAYVVGMLHDIGRRVGIVNIPRHVYEGYRYSMKMGWDEVARICMTHSYPLMQEEFDYEPDTEEERAIKAYILNCQIDDYDRLIQICDALATDYGFVILEKRFVDVPFMMSCRISEGRHCYVHRRGSHLQINNEKVQQNSILNRRRSAYGQL